MQARLGDKTINDRSVIESPDPRGGSLWVDGYLPSAPVEQPQSAGFQLDTSWVRGVLFRQRWLILGTVFAALLGGMVVTLLATPIYQSAATVRVGPLANCIVEGQDVSSPVSSLREIDSFMHTQGKVIESRNLAQVVAENLDFGNRYALLGADIDEQRPPNRSDEEWLEDKTRLAANVLLENVEAEIPNDSMIITIRFQSPDPVLAAEIANGYAEAFAQADTRRTLESNTYAQEILLERIAELREQLQASERATNTFARNVGIVTQQTTGTEGEGGQTITGANLASINQTVADARAARIAAEQRWRAIQSVPASQLPEVQNNGAVQSLIAQRAELQGQLSDLRQRYNDEFPEIVDVTSRIELLDRQIREVGENVKASVRNEFVIARNQEAALQAELASSTESALVEQDRQVELTSLDREAAGLRDELSNLLSRYNSISTASNVQSGAISVLDSATVPDSPISPNLLRNMSLALVLGVALAGGLALMREIFVDQFRRAEDLEDRLGISALGMTPYVKTEDIHQQEVNKFSSLMESYASIRSKIDFALAREGAVLQLTSSQASEGKSTTSLILAELFARLGRKTLLVDADLRKPSVFELLDADRPPIGLTEVLLGQAELKDAVFKGVHENLDVLSVASIPSNPVEIVSSPKLRDFIEEHSKSYSLILIDSSPVLGLADAPQIAKLVDGTVFIIEANRTSFSQARTALRRLQGVGANVVGGILTKYRALEAGSDYGYRYDYYSYGDGDK